MLTPRLASLVVLGMVVIACRPRPPSNVQGHYEHGGDASDLEAYAGKLVAVPEYAPSKAVLLSVEALRSAEVVEQLYAIARAPIDEVILIVPPGMPTSTAEVFASVDDRLGTSIAASLGHSLAKIRVLRRSEPEGRSLWVRDFAPITTRHRDTGEVVLVEFNYQGSRPSDDALPKDLGDALGVKRISLPLYNEGGNFMVNDSGDCMMTERVVELNAHKTVEADEVFDRDQIEDIFRKYLDCKTVHIFPSMPHEATGHVDIWGKFLTNKKILVSRMSAETAASSPAGYFQEVAEDIRAYLEARAIELTNLGFEVVEVPFPAPDSGDILLIRSYANSLFINGQALVPVYERNRIPNLAPEPYVDEPFLGQYNARARAAYEGAGYEYVPVRADDLVQMAGAVHCSTMQLGLRP